MACRTACPTQDHASWGACARAARTSVIGLESTGPGITRERELTFEKENRAYDAAIAEGLNPKAVSIEAVDAARKAADQGV